VHIVLVDGIVGDGLEKLQLVAVMKLRARNIDEGCVCERDAEGVDADIGKLVNSSGVDKRRIALLEHRSALATKVLAKSPLIGSTIAANFRPPYRVVGLLFLQPSTQVGTIGLECLPVDKIATVNTLAPIDIMAVTDGAKIYFRDAERTFIVEGNSSAVISTIIVQVDTERG
jgi:hypothetical protein